MDSQSETPQLSSQSSAKPAAPAQPSGPAAVQHQQTASPLPRIPEKKWGKDALMVRPDVKTKRKYKKDTDALKDRESTTMV